MAQSPVMAGPMLKAMEVNALYLDMTPNEVAVVEALQALRGNVLVHNTSVYKNGVFVPTYERGTKFLSSCTELHTLNYPSFYEVSKSSPAFAARLVVSVFEEYASEAARKAALCSAAAPPQEMLVNKVDATMPAQELDPLVAALLPQKSLCA